MTRIVVLDYGSSNLRSVAKALETVSSSKDSVAISSDAKTIFAADRVVFPGQGAIGQCMRNLKQQNLDEVIRDCIANNFIQILKLFVIASRINLFLEFVWACNH